MANPALFAYDDAKMRFYLELALCRMKPNSIEGVRRKLPYTICYEARPQYFTILSMPHSNNCRDQTHFSVELTYPNSTITQRFHIYCYFVADGRIQITHITILTDGAVETLCDFRAVE